MRLRPNSTFHSLHRRIRRADAFAFAFLSVIPPRESASVFAVALAFLSVIPPRESASVFAVALAFLSVIPLGNLLLSLPLLLLFFLSFPPGICC
jgi:hypothetical protein